jgi:hypothetical protein
MHPNEQKLSEIETKAASAPSSLEDALSLITAIHSIASSRVKETQEPIINKVPENDDTMRSRAAGFKQRALFGAPPGASLPIVPDIARSTTLKL